MALIDALVADLSAVRSILQSKSARRGQTLRHYLTLRARYIAQVRILGQQLNSERLFGTQMTAGSYANLVYLFSEVFAGDEYAFDSATPAPIILDCGANIGMATLYFKLRYPESRITAFEPAPATFECLRRNTASLKGVEVRNQAIAGRPGTLDLFLDPKESTSPMASTSPGRVQGQRVSVEAVTLSSIITGPIDFLKMDIEGAEMEAIEELESSGKLPLVAQMAVEYHHHLAPGDDRFSRFLLLLERAGFGYQLRASPAAMYRPDSFQDVLVYAYRRA